MIKLFKGAQVYAPEALGKKDVLVVDEKICRIADEISGYEGLADAEIFDLAGKSLVPGYIDMHVHITGGGGEQGPASRVPEAQLSALTRCGVTTVLGLLGTDGITRSLENLVAKARALTEEGITAYALTGSYGYPSQTLTGSVERDIMLVPPVIGVKIAVSDHRSSNPTGEELIRLATDARRGGMLSGSAGLVTMHMGSGKGGLEPIFYALDHSDLPARNLLPTHMLRTPELFAQGEELIRRGGFIDLTAPGSEERIKTAAEQVTALFARESTAVDHVTLSSDAFGSQPRFDDTGECIGLTYSTPQHLHEFLCALVRCGLPLASALKLLTKTPAYLLGKSGQKGCVAPGADADLLVLDESLAIESVFARGKAAILHGDVKMKGKFEE